jgi:hypothetical protein
MFKCLTPDILHHQLKMLDITLNIYKPAVNETLPLQGSHPTLGIIMEPHPEYEETTVFTQCEPGTVAFKNIQT